MSIRICTDIEHMLISDYAAGKDIVVFGRDACPHCVKAKELLNEYTTSWTYVDLTTSDRLLRDKLKRLTNMKTIPIVFVRMDDNSYECIGGYTELNKYVKGLKCI